jgi:polar amino acid transport system substrate-binding protein
MIRLRYIPVLALAAVLPLTACATNTEGLVDNTDTPEVSADQALVDSVPAEIRDRGSLQVATNAGVPPTEYKNSDGEFEGFSIDFVNAIGEKLDLKIEFVDSVFPNIIPGIIGGKYDMGAASFTDTKEREKTVDFVTYMEAGSQWVAKADSDLDPADACGRPIAVLAGGFQASDVLPPASKACTDAGKPAIEVLEYDTQDAVLNAVTLGRADGLVNDSTACAYVVQQSKGELKIISEIEGVYPFGFVLAKENKLTPVIQATVEALMADGTYQEILEKWNLQDGATTESKINDARF